MHDEIAMCAQACDRPFGALDFGQALEALRRGERVARFGWNGRGMWLGLQQPGLGTKMSRPFIFMKDAQGELVPWLASQTDVLADDWVVVRA